MGIGLRLFTYMSVGLSGFCALVYQVVWQRFATVIWGSDSKATVLVLAAFLTGLSLGYYLFGRWTKESESRATLIKRYAYLEFGIAAFGLLMPMLFSLIMNHLDWLHFSGVEYVLCFLVFVPPTLLMGGTLPLLTVMLPENAETLYSEHRRIYALNTLGASLGVLVAAVWIIPSLGLHLSSDLAAMVNIAIGIFFLSAYAMKTKHRPLMVLKSFTRESSATCNHVLYALAFVSGVSTISLEIIWVRLVGLSIGMSGMVFPITIFVFIFWIGLGALSWRRASFERLQMGLLGGLFLMIPSFWCVSHLPLWASAIRVVFSTIPLAFWFYHAAMIVLLSIILGPMLFCLGRLLPMTYALIEKQEGESGSVCGRLYSLNTIGTLIGSLVIAHSMIFWVSYEFSYKLIMTIVAAMALWMWTCRRRMGMLTALVLIATVGLIIGGRWDRSKHVVGLFQDRNFGLDILATSLTSYPLSRIGMTVLNIQDDPISTIGVVKTAADGDHYAICVNAKNDSSTAGDMATTYLLGLLPYLYHSSEHPLDVAVIGLGTGTTAGLVGKLDGVHRVVVSEISPAVVSALPWFKKENFDVQNQARVSIDKRDAFRFMSLSNDQFDMVVSEPSNPWTAGVENLFSDFFYEKVKLKLRPDGILSQWFHLYSISSLPLVTVMKTIRRHFAYVEMYASQASDVIIVASNAPFVWNPNRMTESWVQTSIQRMGIPAEQNTFDMMKVMSQSQFDFVVNTQRSLVHDADFPRLGFVAYQDYFLGRHVEVESVLNPYWLRGLWKQDHANAPLHLERDPRVCYNKGVSYFCEKVQSLRLQLNQLRNSEDVAQRLNAYDLLRNGSVLSADPRILNDIQRMLQQKCSPARIPLAQRLIHEHIKDWNWEGARESIRMIKAWKCVPEDMLNDWVKLVLEHQQQVQKRT